MLSIIHVELVPDKSIISRSVQKMVFYREADGSISQRLVTYIPDKKYPIRRKNEIALNSILKIQSDFCGYIEYSEWDGDIVAILRVENGKDKRRYTPTPVNNRNVNGVKSGGVSTNSMVCNTVCYDQYNTGCNYTI